MSGTLYLSGDVNSEMVGRVLQRLEDGALDRIVINSTGGDACDAFAIYDALIGRNITIIATGVCMSAAVIILLAGAHRYATEHTRFLLHPVGVTPEDDAEITETDIAESAAIQDQWATALHQRAGMTLTAAQLMLSAENYFSAEDAQKMGIIDGIWQETKQSVWRESMRDTAYLKEAR